MYVSAFLSEKRTSPTPSTVLTSSSPQKPAAVRVRPDAPGGGSGGNRLPATPGRTLVCSRVGRRGILLPGGRTRGAAGAFHPRRAFDRRRDRGAARPGRARDCSRGPPASDNPAGASADPVHPALGRLSLRRNLPKMTTARPCGPGAAAIHGRPRREYNTGQGLAPIPSQPLPGQRFGRRPGAAGGKAGRRSSGRQAPAPRAGPGTRILTRRKVSHGRDGHRLWLRRSGHGRLPGEHRPHRPRRGEGRPQAQDPPGRPLPDLRAGAAGADAGELRLRPDPIHRQRQGGRQGRRGRLPLRRHAAQARRHRRHELPRRRRQGSLRRAGRATTATTW